MEDGEDGECLVYPECEGEGIQLDTSLLQEAGAQDDTVADVASQKDDASLKSIYFSATSQGGSSRAPSRNASVEGLDIDGLMPEKKASEFELPYVPPLTKQVSSMISAEAISTQPIPFNEWDCGKGQSASLNQERQEKEDIMRNDFPKRLPQKRVDFGEEADTSQNPPHLDSTQFEEEIGRITSLLENIQGCCDRMEDKIGQMDHQIRCGAAMTGVFDVLPSLLD